MSNVASKKMCSGDAKDGKGDDEGRKLIPRDLGILLLPPRLEDAGLEDCALSPESIQEAFSIAAKSLQSRFTSSYYSEDDKNEGGTEGDTSGRLCVEAWPAGSGNDLIISSEGNSGGSAIGKGGAFLDEKALDRYVVLEECEAEVPGLGHGLVVHLHEGTGTGKGQQQSEQPAGSDEVIDTRSRAGI